MTLQRPPRRGKSQVPSSPFIAAASAAPPHPPTTAPENHSDRPTPAPSPPCLALTTLITFSTYDDSRRVAKSPASSHQRGLECGCEHRRSPARASPHVTCPPNRAATVNGRHSPSERRFATFPTASERAADTVSCPAVCSRGGGWLGRSKRPQLSRMLIVYQPTELLAGIGPKVDLRRR